MRRRRASVTLLATLTAALVWLTGCSIGAPADARSEAGFISGDGTTTQYAADERKAAPDISGERVGGGEISLTDFDGSIVVLNFWGSWCPPCRAEADDLATVYEEHKDDGVEFLGINVRDTQDKAAAFERSFSVPYPSVFDPAGRVALKLAETPPNAIPTTIILDAQHRVATVIRKPLVADDLRPLVREIVED